LVACAGGGQPWNVKTSEADNVHSRCKLGAERAQNKRGEEERIPQKLGTAEALGAKKAGKKARCVGEKGGRATCFDVTGGEGEWAPF